MDILEFLGGILRAVATIAFWVVISAVLVKAINRKNQKKGRGRTAAAPKRAGGKIPQNKPAPAKTSPVPPAVAKAKRQAERKQRKLFRELNSSDWSVHDSDDDWLSTQLKEERKALRDVSAMFELKMSHMNNCAAEDLKRSHAENCDAKKVQRKSR